VEGGGDDQPDGADEFDDSENHPGFARQRTKGRDILARHRLRAEHYSRFLVLHASDSGSCPSHSRIW
jgi:hypothetical protein